MQCAHWRPSRYEEDGEGNVVRRGGWACNAKLSYRLSQRPGVGGGRPLPGCLARVPARLGRGEERRPCRALEDSLRVRAAPGSRPDGAVLWRQAVGGQDVVLRDSRRDLQGLADALPGGEAGGPAGRIHHSH
eukprot:14160787-Alexandrium_andersonii.AAC.1